MGNTKSQNYALSQYFYCTHPLYIYYVSLGAWLSERLRYWSNEPDVVGSIPVTTEIFLSSFESNQVPE